MSKRGTAGCAIQERLSGCEVRPAFYGKRGCPTAAAKERSNMVTGKKVVVLTGFGLAALFGINQSAGWAGIPVDGDLDFRKSGELQRSLIRCRSSWPAEGAGEAVAVEEIAVEEVDRMEEIIREAEIPTVRRMEPDLLQGPRTARGMVQKMAPGPATLTAAGQKDREAKTSQIRSHWIVYFKIFKTIIKGEKIMKKSLAGSVIVLLVFFLSIGLGFAGNGKGGGNGRRGWNRTYP